MFELNPFNHHFHHIYGQYWRLVVEVIDREMMDDHGVLLAMLILIVDDYHVCYVELDYVNVNNGDDDHGYKNKIQNPKSSISIDLFTDHRMVVENNDDDFVMNHDHRVGNDHLHYYTIHLDDHRPYVFVQRKRPHENYQLI